MTMKLPDFKNHEEEVEFWATADIFEYTEPADIKVELASTLQKTMKPITIRLRGKQIDDLKIIAQKKDLPYQTMVRSWISERIRKELDNENRTLEEPGSIESFKNTKPMLTIKKGTRGKRL